MQPVTNVTNFAHVGVRDGVDMLRSLLQVVATRLDVTVGGSEMAADQKNFQLYKYVDDNGVSWNKRGELSAPRNAVDGNAAFGAFPNWGRETRRHSVRKIRYTDSTTFRTKEVIFYTAAAYAAVAVGTDVLAEHVEGETATVNYTATKKIPERQPSAAGTRQLSDHA